MHRGEDIGIGEFVGAVNGKAKCSVFEYSKQYLLFRINRDVLQGCI